MRDRVRGIIFCAFWYLSIIAGFFVLICPILPLVVLSPKKYRKWSDLIFGMWEPFPVALMEVCFGIRVVLSGDKINPFEGSLFVMNHRTRVDWTFLWLGLFHCCQPNAHNMKYVLKAPIMHVPGPGWVMQTCSFIFVHRNWEKDKPLLNNIVDYLNSSDQLYQILLFPEGTDLSDDNIRKSHRYAEKNNLEKYYRVLHPRTTGFAFLAQKMKEGGQLKAVYDVTVAYPKTMPLTEADLLRGKFPEEVHFNVKRYGSAAVPGQEDELKDWLTTIWKEKETKLERFYTTGQFGRDRDGVDYGKVNLKNGSIGYGHGKTGIPVGSTTSVSAEPGPSTESETYIRNHQTCDSIYRSSNYRPSHLLYVVLTFWIVLIALTVYGLMYNVYMQVWVLTHALLFTALSFVSNGFHHLAAAIYFHRYDRQSVRKTK